MQLPRELKDKKEWILVGPMGPRIPAHFQDLPIVGVDGGGNFCKKLNLWIGDQDSITKSVCADFSFLLPKDKHKSDLACAFDLISQSPVEKTHLWGFLGGRTDHELFNLGAGIDFLRTKSGELFYYNYQGEKCFHLLGEGKWHLSHQGVFSLGVLSQTSLTITGNCKYQLQNPTLLNSLSSQGLSNEAWGDFYIENENPVFLYFPRSL
jgi:thiamine pyrophosphokinase